MAIEQKATAPEREPVLVRTARYILENGATHVDNFTGCIVHSKKVERALVRMGIDPEMTEQDEVEGRHEAPIVIKRSHGGPKINPVLLDATTASMIVQIYDALSPTNQASFHKLVPRVQVTGTVDRLWKLVRK